MLRDFFRCLIECGDGWTKAELTKRLNQIKSYNTKEFIVIDEEEYNVILKMINSSNLPN